MELNDWHQERQLYSSPYSGCRCFSGWAKPISPKIPVQTSWPSPYKAPGPILCVDRIHSTCSGVKTAANGVSGAPMAIPAGSVCAQRVHFRPSAPFPMWIKGGPPVPACPRIVRPIIGKPPYNLRALSFPSTSGPYTIGIASGVNGSLIEIVVGAVGSFSQHNAGWS